MVEVKAQTLLDVPVPGLSTAPYHCTTRRGLNSYVEFQRTGQDPGKGKQGNETESISSTDNFNVINRIDNPNSFIFF